ncbi:MAG TPA: urocanate hydratase [Methanomassiliicoccales archaeon]|nr:urocanate hydratase [Methanomassiliicoccales archaeon]
MQELAPVTLDLAQGLPEPGRFDASVRRAPERVVHLSRSELALSLRNALRYIPSEWHERLAPEFLDELLGRGRIYAYRFRPHGAIKAKPVDKYKGVLEARAIQVMIDNNLDFEVALYPYELVTYGETGQVCQNWMQYLLIKKYLEVMRDDQTLVVMSGHPLGLFPSKRDAPRVVVTNGLMVGMFDTPDGFQKAQALGVANYGQMTAGGWMYIGPQGIVHGTYLTLLNAARKYLGFGEKAPLGGTVYLSSGLGGMSGAQAKAIEIAGGVGVIAEVDFSRIKTRSEQGWLTKWSRDLDEIFEWVEKSRSSKQPMSIGYYGNVVDLWQHVLDHQIKVELASDQTSCHAVYEGGYTPVGVTFEEGRELIANDPRRFRELVDASLRRQYALIMKMRDRGTKFWDYGNSFLKAVYDAGERSVAIDGDPKNGFVLPSYVEDIIGPLCFDRGYGPFRWVCLSGDPKDLDATDIEAMKAIHKACRTRSSHRGMDRDNYLWLNQAASYNLVVGTQARILYADGPERVDIAKRFNHLVHENKVGPIMLGRDHHDVSGTDSPFRETANIKDGSNVMSEMAHQCWAGNAARGMTFVVLSNGGGVGTGKAINGGFGLVLDGSERVDSVIESALDWDVACGIARRAWAGNENALATADEWNAKGAGRITMPFEADDRMIDELVKRRMTN